MNRGYSAVEAEAVNLAVTMVVNPRLTNHQAVSHDKEMFYYQSMNKSTNQSIIQ